MGEGELRVRLERLLALLLRERECAKAVDIENLQALTLEKEELLQQLTNVSPAAPELRALAERIKRENRRNAYLFWATLRHIRESMNFFARQCSPSSYGARGDLIQLVVSGLVLTVRV